MNKKDQPDKKARQEEVLQKDGTPLELKVEEIFEKMGCGILKQEPYFDPYDQKQKTIDVLASFKKTVHNYGQLYLDRPVTIEMRFFIECKYIPREVILYTDPPNAWNWEQAFLWIGGYRDLYPQWKIGSELKNHRYLSAQEIISTSSDNNENGYGMKAVHQACHGILSGNLRSSADYVFDYPVVVWSSAEYLSIKRKDSIDLVDYWSNLGLLFEYKYIHPQSRIKGLFYVDMLTLENIQSFVVARYLDFSLLAEKIIPYDAFFSQQEQKRTDSESFM